MRILLSTWRYTLRRVAGVVLELSAQGHEAVVAYPSGRKPKLSHRLRDVPGVRLELYDEVSDPDFGRALALLRQARDYAWYLSPEQRVAYFNRTRALDNLVRTASGGALRADRSWPDPAVPVDPEVAATVDELLGGLDAALPPDPGVVELLERERPDAVLVSPLVRQNTHQTEVVKAAAALGIPSGLLVYSWDTLSNKGRIHAPPDRVFAWNELQRREAEELHGLDPASVVVTGAPHWDAFFGREPTLSREELAHRHGFDPGQPIVLYLGSTNEVCPDEPAVVDAWLDTVRGAGGLLGGANVLVRRHPNEADRWKGWRPRHERVALAGKPKRTSQDLFDQLHHAAAAVALNTSAQIEASIVGRPVYTFSAGTAAPAQEGSRHFYYLLEGDGGVVTYADTLDEHVAQLERGLAGEFDAEAIHRFAEWFVRPRGIDLPVAPIVAEEIVRLAEASPTRARRVHAAA
jgi:hypothetical protein